MNGDKVILFAHMYFTNARSLCNKLPILIALTNSHIYDILIFIETWLNDNIPNSMLVNYTYYILYRYDRHANSRGGGILVYIKSTFNSYNIDIPIKNNIEISCQVFNDNTKLITVYRPPYYDLTQTNMICTILDKLLDTTDMCFILAILIYQVSIGLLAILYLILMTPSIILQHQMD